jgi:haloacid dehalogenase superfamily, subfamily IA, variant 3 with third motif having DD or ED/haloacid dehalogenase superfamily, subfamily IA, variant 1 with third motif having Dx(3-4)D or Dx(3-4)E
MTIKAVIFDYIGTLVNCRGYNMADSEDNLYRALVAEGFGIEKESFLDAYNLAHKKYRVIRYEHYREVTNAVWVAEALCSLGFKVAADDPRVKAGLDVFFQDFIDTLELRDGAVELLAEVGKRYRLGLLSNFTYGPVIHKSLRKIGIDKHFQSIIVSEEIGWRKPSPVIFQDMLQRLGVAADEALFIGDSPMEDIKGALDMGIKTLFVPSQFNSLQDLKDSKLEPDSAVPDLQLLSKELEKILPK